jgi:hypothetical protein
VNLFNHIYFLQLDKIDPHNIFTNGIYMDIFNTPERLLIIVGLGGALQGIILQLVNVEFFEGFQLVLAFVAVICFVGVFAINRIGAPNTTIDVVKSISSSFSDVSIRAVLAGLFLAAFAITQNPENGFLALFMIGSTVQSFISSDKTLRSIPAK